MERKSVILAFVTVAGILLLGESSPLSAQDLTPVGVIRSADPELMAAPWTLKQCIDYAKANNIQVLSQEITKETADVSLEQAKGQLLPSLNFSSGLNAGLPGKTVGSNFSLGSNLSLYQGGKLRNSIQQQTLQGKAAECDLEQAKIDLEISVAQAYLQVMYCMEQLQIARDAEQLSRTQYERGEALMKAGSLTRGAVAQLKSEYASSTYKVVSAENSLSTARLSLKQLLELGMAENFDILYPDITDDVTNAVIPSLKEIYNIALEDLPGMKSSRIAVESSELAVEIAKGSYLPSVSLNANAGTSALIGSDYGTRLAQGLNEGIGLSLSVPIFNGWQTRSNVAKAKLQNRASELQNASAEKQLLNSLESLRNEALSAQQKFIAATEQREASEQSYAIVQGQFERGAVTAVDLLNEKNNYISALSQQLQAKYQAILAIKVLGRYMNEPIEL